MSCPFDSVQGTHRNSWLSNDTNNVFPIRRQVFCRSFADTPTVSRSPADKPSSPLNADKAESMQLSPCNDVEGLCKEGCLADVHSWVLALAVRACRRRLLEMSGWREDHAGTKEGLLAFPLFIDRGTVNSGKAAYFFFTP